MIGDVMVPILVIVTLVAVNGLFVAAEFALVGARRSRLATLAEGGSRVAAWLVALVDRPTGKDAYIAVAQLGITLASIGLGMYGEPAVAGWLYGPFEDWGLSEAAAHTVGFVVALSGITYLHVVLGEMIPKALALQAPEGVSLRVNPVMRVFSLLFRPMVAVLNTVAFALMRLLRIPEPDAVRSLHTSTELAIVTEEAARGGLLGAVPAGLVRNILGLGEHTAAELMAGRSQVEVLDATAPADEVLAAVLGSTRSRYPVVRGDLDDVVGLVHVKDLIRAHEAGEPLDLVALSRPLPVVLADSSAEVLLGRFRQDRVHAALVVDEHGSTVGFVTLDDVLDEVVDRAPGPEAAALASEGSVVVDGATTLADARGDLGLDLEHPVVHTVAGLLLAELGRLPRAGEAVVVGGVEVVAEAVEGTRVTRVRITPGR